jgi:hypothetical protein
LSQVSPTVYKAVRAVGIMRPQFEPGQGGRVFADKLDVLGTAFFVRDSKFLVTCAHVAEALAKAPVEVAGFLVVGNRGRYTRAFVEVVDGMHDLAILRPELSAEEVAAEAAEGLELVAEYPVVGASVAYAGYPLGTQLLTSNHEPTYAQGVIGASLRQQGQQKKVQVTGAVVGGFSGAPVVSPCESNKVVGVLSHSPSVEAGQASIFMAISWEHVKRLVDLANS